MSTRTQNLPPHVGAPRPSTGEAPPTARGPVAVEGGATVEAALERALHRGRTGSEPVMRSLVGVLTPKTAHQAGYHLGWWEADPAPGLVPARGKGLRPALAFAAAAAVSGGRPPAAAWVAAAVEFVHAFTLVHDDLMDDSPLRRGAPTVWKVWGVGDAVLLGDTLQALASRALTLGFPRRTGGTATALLSETVLELCQGQALDGQRDDQFPTRETCVATAEAKTGSLMGTACALGAMAGDAPLHVIEALDRFGRALGVAFQMLDDVSDVWSSTEDTGKPSGLDLLQRKPTYPVAVAFDSPGTSTGELDLWWHSPTDATPPIDVVRVLDDLDVRRRCLDDVDDLLSCALEDLRGVTGLPHEHLDGLEAVATHLRGRTLDPDMSHDNPGSPAHQNSSREEDADGS